VSSGAVGVDVEEAARIAGDLYDLEGEVSPLPGEKDLNFRLRRGPSESYVLKLHHPESDPLELSASISDRLRSRPVVSTTTRALIRPPSRTRVNEGMGF
jgi:Ser/Thr protein kinase RdoA (MazF antagonist)